MGLFFKECGPNDIIQLGKISKETFVTAFEAQNNPQDFKEYIKKAFSRATLRKELNNEHSHFFFVYQNKELIGYFKLNEFTAQNELQEKAGMELERIYIINAYQGQGFGAKTLSYALNIAKKKGKQYIWLGVWEHNLEAIRFYSAHGFEKFDTHPYFIGNDEQTDWLMRKKL